MSDLIKRSDAIKAMEQRYKDILRIFKRKVKDGEKAIVLDMIGCIKSLPSADRQQGTWFKDDEGTFICSACGSGYKDQPTIMGKPMFEWCPVCGCRMKGADDDC